jgi:predicted DNA-binding WGR domain protein
MKYMIHGPIQDGMFTLWQVIGPKGGIKVETFTKREALIEKRKLESQKRSK